MTTKLFLLLLSAPFFFFGQKPGSKKLIEYTKSLEKGSVNANVFIPSFEKTIPDTQVIKLSRKNDVWIYLNYKRKNQPENKDTIYIATYTENRWKDGDAAIFENACAFTDVNCNFIVSSTELHYVRFRWKDKVKYYKLLVKG